MPVPEPLLVSVPKLSEPEPPVLVPAPILVPEPLLEEEPLPEPVPPKVPLPPDPVPAPVLMVVSLVLVPDPELACSPVRPWRWAHPAIRIPARVADNAAMDLIFPFSMMNPFSGPLRFPRERGKAQVFRIECG